MFLFSEALSLSHVVLAKGPKVRHDQIRDMPKRAKDPHGPCPFDLKMHSHC